MEKNWYQSKTIIAAALLIFSGSLASIGITIDADGNFSGNIYDIAEKGWPYLSQILAGIGIWYGRTQAVSQIAPVSKKKATRR
jgi:hypothetical protein